MGKMIFTDLISAGMRPVWMFAGMRPAWMFAGLISAGMKPARVMVLAGICCAMINLEVTHAQAAHPISDAYTFTSENDEDAFAKGMRAFYRADWDQANTHFLSGMASETEPEPLFYASLIPFWDYFFVGESSEKAARYMSLSENAIERAKIKYDAQPADTTLISMLGGLYGYRGLIAARERKPMQALRNGLRGLSYTKQLNSSASERPEVLIGSGVYNYMSGRAPAGMKWTFSLLNVKPGEVDTGFQYLEKAAAMEDHLAIEAASILAYIYLNEEMYMDAARHWRRLSEQFPSNPIFHYYLAEAYYHSGYEERASEYYLKVVSLNSPHMSELTQLSQERLQDPLADVMAE
jgi:tetratricopeptide (TPR) repeat protein